MNSITFLFMRLLASVAAFDEQLSVESFSRAARRLSYAALVLAFLGMIVRGGIRGVSRRNGRLWEWALSCLVTVLLTGGMRIGRGPC
jgi:hypothetical protein